MCGIFAAAGGSADTCVGGVLLRKRLSGLRQPQPAAGFQAGASGGRACRRRTAPRHHRRYALAERTGTAECTRRQHQPRHRTHLVATGTGSLRAVRHTLLCPQQRQRAAYTYFVCRGKRQGICTGIAGLRTETVEQAVAPVLAEQAAAVLPYAQAAEPEPSAAAVALEKLEQRMRRLAAELGEPHAAAAFLREELQRLGTEHQRLEQELRQNASEPPLQPAENWEAWWQMPVWNSVDRQQGCSCGKCDCFRHTGKYICNKTKRAPPEGDALSMHLRACRFSYTCCCYRSECLLSLLSNQCYATDYSYSYSYASYRQSIASLRRRSGLSRLLGCGSNLSSGSSSSYRCSSRSCCGSFGGSRFRFTNDSDGTSAARSNTNVTSYTILNRHILAIRILTRNRYGELVTNLSSGRNLNNDFSELASSRVFSGTGA